MDFSFDGIIYAIASRSNWLCNYIINVKIVQTSGKSVP